MKALFIGGSGYIGKNLMKLMNHEETAYYSRHKIEGKEYDGFNWIQGDVSEKDKLIPLIQSYDVIYYLANTYSTDEKESFAANVQGIKDVATEVKRIDKNQRLIYFSSINVHYGQNEYFRTRRTGEDNAALVKNHLNVRLSFVFGGDGDYLSSTIASLLKKGLDRFEKGGRICPTHIRDLAETIKKSEGIFGSIYTNSTSQLTFVDCINIYAKHFGLPEVKEMSGFLARNTGSKLIEEGKIDKITYDRVMANYYRESSSLIRFIKEEKKYEDHVAQLLKA